MCITGEQLYKLIDVINISLKSGLLPSINKLVWSSKPVHSYCIGEDGSGNAKVMWYSFIQPIFFLKALKDPILSYTTYIIYIFINKKEI